MSRVAALAAVAITLALPAVARAEATVSVTGGALSAAVAPGANNLTGHGVSADSGPSQRRQPPAS
jgi:hypothetical protein